MQKKHVIEGKWFVEDKDWLLDRRVLEIMADRNHDAEFIGEHYIIIYVD